MEYKFCYYRKIYCFNKFFFCLSSFLRVIFLILLIIPPLRHNIIIGFQSNYDSSGALGWKLNRVPIKFQTVFISRLYFRNEFCNFLVILVKSKHTLNFPILLFLSNSLDTFVCLHTHYHTSFLYFQNNLILPIE